MALGDFLAHLGLRDTPEPAAAEAPTDRPPTADALREQGHALHRTRGVTFTQRR